jgi:hypothetical protein
VEETRQTLRKAGFKTDFGEFNFVVPPGERGFELALNAALTTGRMGESFDSAKLMPPVGSNSIIVVWKEETVETGMGDATWPEFSAALSVEESKFTVARAEALLHPIRFDLQAMQGSRMRLPHLATAKRASLAFSSATIADLHDQDRDSAWTNLLATTRLVTGWNPEPTEISHLVRFALTSIASDTTWQALQADGWSDAQLAKLQQEWESVDFFKGLPETVAFQRVSVVDECEQMLKEELGISLGELFREMMRSPQDALRMLKEYWSQLRYRTRGIYVDEVGLLLFYRDREVEMRNAIRAPTWAAMRAMPGVTNQPVFTSKYRSPMQVLWQTRGMGIGFAREGASFLGRASEAEVRRRLILAAIALERFRIRHGNYPKSLQELTPDLLKVPATDFMDGQPLRYHVTDDARFVLHSTGLDCVDDGGILPRRFSRNSPRSLIGNPRNPLQPSDLVWPRAASTNEIAALRAQEVEEQRQEVDQMAEMQSEHYWDRTASRQAKAETTLTSPATVAKDPNYNGRPLSEILRNENTSGTNKLTLQEMLTLHQVITGSEPEKITFEVPIKFNALTNLGGLALYIDSLDGDSEEGCGVAQMECSRATNGNCLLVWNTIFESPGKHALLMGLITNDSDVTKAHSDTVGPPLEIVVSNLCQFSITSANFDPAIGANFRARLPELKGDYSIDMLSLKGERLKTLSGSTTNGIINESWDLIDERGQKLQDQAFNTVIHIALPESGRSQTLKGP